MTTLSIVLPVYRVQGYLRQCLDSMLGQSFTDFEIVAVDDCSPDYSGAILAEYAARDSRIRVVTSPENVGLGRARNLGLRHAVGTYVWFVDSDDWLATGAFAAVAGRLRATDADVLVVGWDRVPWDGPVQPGSARRLLGAAPKVFAVQQWPMVLDVLHVAWNRVIRRDLLVKLGIEFAPGWYEDVSFTYPLMLATRRISALPRTCVHYRQRRTGAITSTVGDRHFEVFEHWAQAFELCAKYVESGDRDRYRSGGGDASEAGSVESGSAPPGEAALLQGLLFRRMLWHYVRVLCHDTRVPPGSRRRFFREMTANYHRYLPPGGFPAPGAGERLRYWLIARGAYRGFLAGELLMQARRWQLGVVSGPARRVARWARLLLGQLYYQVQLRLPVDPTLAVFAAYWYRGVACNPAAIAVKAAELTPQVHVTWVVNSKRLAAVPPGTDVVVPGTLRYYRALARAHYLVNNVNWPNYVVKRRGTTHVMTHHGTPLKMMGMDQLEHPAGARDADFAGQMRRADRWDVSVTANAHTTIAWERAYPCRYETLEVGYPRNDRLATATAAEVAAAREKLGLPPGRRVVLYMPTHREWLPEGTPVLEVEQLAAVLGRDTTLLVRAHYFYVSAEQVGRRPSGFRRIVDVSGYPTVEDLYLAADVMLTDYSSAMFDYAVLDRPLVVYAPDWSVYRELRGVYFDLLAEPPGAVATDFPTLTEIFRSGAFANEEATELRRRFRARFCYLEDGSAAERVVRRVFS